MTTRQQVERYRLGLFLIILGLIVLLFLGLTTSGPALGPSAAPIRIAGRPRNLDIQDYRAGMTRHLTDGRGKLRPHDRADPINGWLNWTGRARTDDPAELAAAMERARMTLEEYLAA